HPFAGIEEGAQAEFRIAIDEADTACLRSGHVRIESGPDIHATLLQCGATLGMLQVHDAYVPGAETMALEGTQQKEVGIRALGCGRSEEHTSELQSRENLVCRRLPEKRE